MAHHNVVVVGPSAGTKAMQPVGRWGTKASGGDSNYLPGEVHGDLGAEFKGRESSTGETLSDRPPQKEADHELLERERAYIKNWLKKTGNATERNLIGLALSGGGIRSATFSLGVLQALARHRVLKHIHYLSTVSGGGYIGAGLTWWLSGQTGSTKAYGLDAESFPYGIADPALPAGSSTPRLTHLRVNASYLVPGGGISYLSGVAILIRAVLLNLLVWIPVAAAILVAMIVLGPKVQSMSDWLPSFLAGAEIEQQTGRFALFNLLIWIGLGAICLFALACVDYAFLTPLANYLDDSRGGPPRQDTRAEVLRKLCSGSLGSLGCARRYSGHSWRDALFLATGTFDLAQ